MNETRNPARTGLIRAARLAVGFGLAIILSGCIVAPYPGYYRPHYHPYYYGY